MNYKVSHPTKNINCEINLPSSKSISNRLLIIRSLCNDYFNIENLSNSNDTISLVKALNSSKKNIDVGHAGTTFRFLTAFFAIQKNKEFILTGSKRLRNRPIKDLAKALQEMGAKIEYMENEGFAPLRIIGSKLKGGSIQINAGISSQFISAILLISPTLENGIQLEVTKDLVSKPYILMTLKLMAYFGIKWSWNKNIISIRQQPYISKNYEVEADWSSASFWFEIAALSKKCKIKLNRVRENSIQGDKKIVDLFTSLGVSSVFKHESLLLTKSEKKTFPKKIDLIESPDLYQPLKCTLYAKDINTEILGLQTLKDKESNRVAVVKKELEKLSSSKRIKTYKDHRMAMSFAPLCLKFGELQITNIEVVNKSYTNFWNDLTKAGFIIYPLSD